MGQMKYSGYVSWIIRRILYSFTQNLRLIFSGKGNSSEVCHQVAISHFALAEDSDRSRPLNEIVLARNASRNNGTDGDVMGSACTFILFFIEDFSL